MRHTRRRLSIIIFAICVFPSTATGQALPEEETDVGAVRVAAPESVDPSKYIQIPPKEAPFRPSIFKSNLKPPAPMPGREKLDFYLDATFGLEPILSSAATSTLKLTINSTPEWGQGIEGYGIRFASSVGRRIIKNSIQHGLGGLLKEDPRYLASGRSGIWQRSFYAVGQTFIANKDSGGRRFAYSNLLGTLGGIFISRQWYPEHSRTAEEYMISIATSLGYDAGRNVFREFWPDIKGLFGR